jgi:hypothetical protein
MSNNSTNFGKQNQDKDYFQKKSLYKKIASKCTFGKTVLIHFIRTLKDAVFCLLDKGVSISDRHLEFSNKV